MAAVISGLFWQPLPSGGHRLTGAAPRPQRTNEGLPRGAAVLATRESVRGAPTDARLRSIRRLPLGNAAVAHVYQEAPRSGGAATWRRIGRRSGRETGAVDDRWPLRLAPRGRSRRPYRIQSAVTKCCSDRAVQKSNRRER